MSKIEISSGEEVKLLVDLFYERVNQDELLSPVFNDYAKVNWETHLPIMYRFWETLLLEKATYNGTPFPKHVALPIKDEHFDRWIDLFELTVEENFKGKVAEEAKLRARSIAGIFKSKMNMLKKDV